MKKFAIASMILGVFVIMAATDSFAGGEKKPAPKCPVKGVPCKKSVSADHNGGKVYFCCAGCQAAFKGAKNGGKFAAKANLQLYITGQAKLVKCPFTGKALNPATKITVAEMPICFCCNNCKAKATAAEGTEQLNLLYNNKAFKKAFKVGKSKTE